MNVKHNQMKQDEIEEKWSHVDCLPPNIEVSNQGRVRIFKTMKTYEFMKQNDQDGYQFISCNGKSFAVHQLVAKAFVPNPEGYKIVKHLDNMRANNCADNLEWRPDRASCREKGQYGIGNRRKIYSPELDKVYSSLRSASYATRIPQDIISYSIQKETKVFGVSFKYINADDTLLADHNLFYIDFDAMVEIAERTASLDKYDEAVSEFLGEGIKKIV